MNWNELRSKCKEYGLGPCSGPGINAAVLQQRLDDHMAKKTTVTKKSEKLDNDVCIDSWTGIKIKSDPDTVFFYFSGSKDAPLPGHGAGEKIAVAKEKNYKELATIKGWRKMLSNFWISKFTLDGLTWNSVEHYYQAAKFKKNNPAFFRLFSIESNSKISSDPLVAKAAGGKSGKQKGVLLRPANVTIDKDFFDSSRCNVDMYRAMFAKFSQNDELRRVLLLTKDATLTHGTRGVPTKPIYSLMKVREDLIEPNKGVRPTGKINKYKKLLRNTDPDLVKFVSSNLKQMGGSAIWRRLYEETNDDEDSNIRAALYSGDLELIKDLAPTIAKLSEFKATHTNLFAVYELKNKKLINIIDFLIGDKSGVPKDLQDELFDISWSYEIAERIADIYGHDDGDFRDFINANKACSVSILLATAAFLLTRDKGKRKNVLASRIQDCVKSNPEIVEKFIDLYPHNVAEDTDPEYIVTLFRLAERPNVENLMEQAYSYLSSAEVNKLLGIFITDEEVRGEYGRHPNGIRFILSKLAPNLTNNKWDALLTEAIEWNSYDTVKLLIEDFKPKSITKFDIQNVFTGPDIMFLPLAAHNLSPKIVNYILTKFPFLDLTKVIKNLEIQGDNGHLATYKKHQRNIKTK